MADGFRRCELIRDGDTLLAAEGEQPDYSRSQGILVLAHDGVALKETA